MKKILIIALLGLAASFTAQAATYNDYVFFGDGLTDIGNNGCKTNATAANSCPTWAFDVYHDLLGKNLVPSSKGGNDYAAAKATAATELPSQVSAYLSKHGGRANPEVLYVILIGSNDVMNTVDPMMIAVEGIIFGDVLKKKTKTQIATDVYQYLITSPNYGSLETSVVNSISNAAATLKNAGAENVLVLNLPDIGQTPVINGKAESIATACKAQHPTDPYTCTMVGEVVRALPAPLTGAINQALTKQLDNQVGVHVFDLFDWQNLFVMDYKEFGTPRFTNNTDTCSGVTDCSSYVFWDKYHPTANMHQVIARQVEKAISSYSISQD
ncbi:MAG: outer rane autotransporter barrel domain protein [Gammaproteobacteria bacterium]|jgi:phospholipase/lecithinase/hemolysin|nr:outer rane autotransporter barrel domain protein [Gammaproteobacteria bacterium]